ncbi:MAG: hypothetical protein JXA87_12810 [Thermoleophilia bacterium]|nr:hypothetical protein [Thermoleophilia bacterium]
MSDVWLVWTIVVVLTVAVGILFGVLFLLTVRETLRRVSGENRAMQADYVWFTFIPLFGCIWFIYMVVKVHDSLRAEYRGRGWPVEGDFGYSVGLAAGVLAIISAIWSWVPRDFLLAGFVLAVGQLVCWVIYWVRIARVKDRLGPPVAGPLLGPVACGGTEDPDGQTRHCEVCGTPVTHDDRYCWRCGSPLP